MAGTKKQNSSVEGIGANRLAAAFPGLTGKRLAHLATLLAHDDKEKPESLVARAIEIWNEAHLAVEPKRFSEWQLSEPPEAVLFHCHC